MSDIDTVDFNSPAFSSEGEYVPETKHRKPRKPKGEGINEAIVPSTRIDGEELRSTTRAICILASQCEEYIYDTGQAGNCEFSFDDVLDYAYRIEFNATDAEIKAEINRLVRKGDILRTTKNHFVTCPRWQTSTDKIKERIARELASRPQSR